MSKIRLEMEQENQRDGKKDRVVTAEKQNNIAHLLVSCGFLSDDQLRYGLRVHAKLTTKRSLLSVLEDLQYISRDQVREALQANPVSVPLGALLTELGCISEEDLSTVLENQRENKSNKLGRLLIDLHLITENDLLRVLSYQLGFPFIELAVTEIDERLVHRAPLKLYRENLFLPLLQKEDGVLIAFADPLHHESVVAAKKIFGRKIVSGIARESGILEAVNRIAAGGKKDSGRSDHVEPNENIIVQAINSILIEANKQGASDIHVEPMRDRLQLRFRKDGVLIPFRDFPLDMAPGITSRIKIMAGADIAERRRHQDGRIFFEEQGVQMDLRVSIYATIHGEKVVMRLLGAQSELLTINELGMAPRTLQRFKEEGLEAPSGVVIITGPTGSGKTSTLYSAVNHLNSPTCSIITAEDPVEYVIDGIAQCSINPKINVTFEETLKHIVRQDPDIIVIGEIRDKFSAEMAIEAALTGHQVLTTFHTEDSTGALIRLLDMGIEAFLIASTVVSVLAQRLVRKVCPACKEDHLLTPDELRRLGYSPKDAVGLTFQKGRGCRKCNFMGYKGRIAIHELLVPNELVKDAVIARKTSYEIRKVSAETTGLVTLLEDGIFKASRGLTTFNEIIRQLPRLDRPRPIAELKRRLGE